MPLAKLKIANIMSELYNYSTLLTEIKSRIGRAQTRAVLAVNAELIQLYWQIGQLLLQQKSQKGWGAGVIPRLAQDIRNELPEVKGFSARNLDRMLAFARTYSQPSDFSPMLVAKLAQPEVLQKTIEKFNEKIKTPDLIGTLSPENCVLWSIPWAHHTLLLEKVKPLDQRLWYMQQTLAYGWSRNTLALQIDSAAHARQGRAVSNFPQRLPSPQSDLAQQALKDPYIFDFLTLESHFHERELETGLILHLEKFLLELGQGFAFVGRQFHLKVGDNDFYPDLLFYHLKLRCFVVIELKRGEFKPEYAGKLNFYCNVIDDQMRHAQDADTIGLMLCQGKDNVLAEYALRGIDKPIGIASYELTRSLPTTLASALPSIETLEAELTAATQAPNSIAKKP